MNVVNTLSHNWYLPRKDKNTADSSTKTDYNRITRIMSAIY